LDKKREMTPETEKNLVSVIIPTYNRAGIIGDTIRSVLNQTYDQFEIIVVDDGSSDNTRQVLEKFNDQRIRYFWYANSGLPAVARNRGLALARGEFIAFVDSDDIWLPEKLAKQVKILKENPDIFLVYTKCFIRKNGKTFSISPKNPKSGDIFIRLYMAYNFIPCLTVLMRNSNTLYCFDENPALRAAEDYDLWLRIAHKERITFIDEPLGIYSMHSENISSDALETLKKWELIIKKFKADVPPVIFCRKYLSFYYRSFFLMTLALKNNLLGKLKRA